MPGKKASCIGGINRMCSQELRGGGAYCLPDTGLWTAFKSIVNGVGPCGAFTPNPCSGSATSKCYWCSTASAVKARQVSKASMSYLEIEEVREEEEEEGEESPQPEEHTRNRLRTTVA